ncbi:MAG TPA: ATP synthase F1 subunit delta [Bryobacteraceae bacterium]|jgi:F-type H+-transporting ATPase subunit delta
MTDALSVHYAEALADAVFRKDSGLAPEEATKQLAEAVDLIDSSAELQNVLLSPAVPRKKKTELIGKLFGESGLHRLIRNFLMVIVEHRRVTELKRIRDSFELAVDERQGYIRGEIITAAELTPEQRQQILHALGSAAGKFIRPVYRVDKNILGGVIARFGSKEYDGSLVGRLEAMRRRLSPAS